MSERRLGILGGTFDPIHCGHIDLALAAERALDLTEVLVMPSDVPPHRPQPVESSYHRFAMVAMSVAGHPGWRASDLELGGGRPSYTSETLQWFGRQGFARTELFFIVGADAFAEVDTWKDYPRIFEHARFAVVSRPGHAVDALRTRLPALASRMQNGPGALDPSSSIVLIDAETRDVSSSAIRTIRASGRSIAGLVAPGVQQHIERHGLYVTPPSRSTHEHAASDKTAGRLHGKG
jgi:nicotinate-nucleotide adenylyltransferase